MDVQSAVAVALPIATVVGGWIVSVERRFAILLAMKDDVAENRADTKDIYKHLLGEKK